MTSRIFLFSTVMGTLALALGGPFPSNVDPAHGFAWCENIGWTNWQHNAPSMGEGVTVSPTYLAGMIWSENVGWINVGNGGGPYANDPSDAATFGVNIDPVSGDTYGKAWGENIGWLNFETSGSLGAEDQQARFDFCHNRFRGYVWGENVGWLNLENASNAIVLGPGCSPGDIACDGVVGLSDYAKFGGLIMGPGVFVDCPVFDADGDGDMDVFDFGTFQSAFTGGD